MKLYEINMAISEVLEKADPETGEIGPEIEAQLDALNLEKEQKLENYALVIKNKRAEAAAIKEEMDCLEKRFSSINNSISWLKDTLARELGDGKIKSACVLVYTRKTERVDVFRDAEAAYWSEEAQKYIKRRETYTWDKVACKDALKAGQKVPGVQLVEKTSVVVR
jgi:hypothetical protein